MKKQLLLLVLMLLPMVAMADLSGRCGDNLTWTYTEATQTLTIEGSGAMDDYTSDGPWYYLRDVIEQIVIGQDVTTIGNRAFYLCKGLTSVTIPNSVTSIGFMAFASCKSLTSVTIPNSVTSIGFMAFDGCNSLTSITIPNSVTSISQPAFNGCTGLTSMKVDSGNTKYDSRDNCNAIIETERNTLIAGCKNTTIPNNVTSIGDSAFYDGYSLTSIIIPNSVTSIGLSAFYFCYGLTQVIIGNGVKSIEKKAFSRCSNIQDMYLYADWIPTTGTDVFYSSYTSYITTLHVPASLLSLYKSTSPWKDFKEIVALTDSDPKPDVTGVNAVRNIEDNKVVIYNFNGVRLNEPQKGINIINGKKYVEK